MVPTYSIQSLWRTKGSTVGMQGLERADAAEESQGHKALGIHRPCLGPVRAQRRGFLSFTLGQQGFEIHPRAAQEFSVEYVGSGLGSGKARVRVNSQGQAVFAKVAMRIIGQQGLWISVRPKEQAHKGFFKSLAEGQVDLI